MSLVVSPESLRSNAVLVLIKASRDGLRCPKYHPTLLNVARTSHQLIRVHPVVRHSAANPVHNPSSCVLKCSVMVDTLNHSPKSLTATHHKGLRLGFSTDHCSPF